jgi:DNA-binding NtrC family response regulator
LLDPLASRHHARLHLENGRAVIEDLESANGTRLGDRRLVPFERTAFPCGEAVVIGTTVVVLQRRIPEGFPNGTLLSHARLERKLIEAVGRAQATKGELALVRFRVNANVDRMRVETTLAELLRPGDLAAEYGPGDYEVLLPDSRRPSVEGFVATLHRHLAERGVDAKVGVAFFPGDGGGPEALMGRACKALAHEGACTGAEPQFVVASEAMRAVWSLVDRVAASELSVIVVGETGVGKEVVSQEIHRRSPRAGGPFVSVNCAALAESLLESELFGHEKGAFSGAVQARQGLLESAAGGTVFLDELGEMSLALQAKVLRAVETRHILRVGSTRPRAIDVRFLAATNRLLDEEIACKAFRSDLYFRLNGMTIEVPALRDRVEEIEPLARMFLRRIAATENRAPPALTAEAKVLLQAYAWPGNIRELRNVVERAWVLSRGETIALSHLPCEKLSANRLLGDTGSPPAVGDATIWRRERSASERRAILDALARCGGNQTRAAELLGISRRTLCARLRAYGIPRPRSA